MLSMGLHLAAVLVPLQLVAGDLVGAGGLISKRSRPCAGSGQPISTSPAGLAECQRPSSAKI